MGYHAGFEEKEYETLMNATLAISAPSQGGMPQLFSPGQALEKELGFDFSAYLDPGSRQYRLLFGRFQGPLLRTPGVTAPAAPQLPPGAPVVNVFLQYKRPEFFRDNHRQPVWQGTSFLRFGVRSRYSVRGARVVDHSQLEALDRLAVHNPHWLVRYACPSVWIRADLYGAFSQSSLLVESSLVDPRHLAIPGGGWHNYWTFDPANPSLGQGNPDGPMTYVENGQDFMTRVTSPGAGSAKTFLGEVDDLINTFRMQRQDDYFEQPRDSSSSGRQAAHTKNEWIDETLGDLDKVLLAAPLDEGWRIRRSGHAPLPPSRPTGNARAAIAHTLEVAATAAELGLTWIVRA